MNGGRPSQTVAGARLGEGVLERMATGVTSAVGRLRRARFTARLAVDVGVLALLCAAVVGLAVSPSIRSAVHAETAANVLTLIGAGVGAATAILAFVGSRLLSDARLAWLAAALVLYCLVVLPWGVTVPADVVTSGQLVSRMIAYTTALVLLAFSLRSPRALGDWGGWVFLLVGGVLALVALLVLPDVGGVTQLVAGPISTVVLLAGWILAAILAVVDAARRQSGTRLRVALGLVILACAQLWRVSVPGRDPATDLVFPALRLLALAVVLVGLLQLVGRGLRRLQEENFVQQEELAAAALSLERAASHVAERDHELRNGLAGLAGITHLLSSDDEGREHERLRGAVLAELSRLHTILESSAEPSEALEADPGPEPPAGYLVEPMLAGLVELRRARGGEVDLQVASELRAVGNPAVGAQIVTNLLANCDRHAPGTLVTVTAFHEQDRVVIEVRDRGPGLPPGREREVTERGVHDTRAGGSGLGLHISRELVEGQGGTLTLRTVDGPPGCAATITLPAADADRPATDSVAR